MPSTYPRRIRIAAPQGYAHHRSGWNHAIGCLSELHDDDGAQLVNSIELDFFGRNESARRAPRQPWIGFCHMPPEMPDWFMGEFMTFEAIGRSRLWRRAEPRCLGLFALSNHLRDWLRARTDVAVESLTHPTETPELKFSMEAWEANSQRSIVQVGWWLRRYGSLHRLRVPTLHKVLLKPEVAHMDRAYDEEMKRLDPSAAKGAVELRGYLPNAEYDRLLSRNIVFLDLYDSSTNNAVIECIVRNTPLLINPIPPMVEHLGEDYPFYFRSLEEAAQKAESRDLVEAAHLFLKAMDKGRFDGGFFRDAFANSSIYRSLTPERLEDARRNTGPVARLARMFRR